jgi:hypothetical protein
VLNKRLVATAVSKAGQMTHYQRVVVAIKETIRLRSEIDKAIPKWPME